MGGSKRFCDFGVAGVPFSFIFFLLGEKGETVVIFSQRIIEISLLQNVRFES